MKLLLLGTLLILTGCISGHVTPVQMETANKACSSYGGTQQMEATGNQATWIKVQCVDGSIHHVLVQE